MLFVYGTRGTAEENAWALAKARYDAETFWYRGNGSVDVVPDTAFDPAAEPRPQRHPLRQRRHQRRLEGPAGRRPGAGARGRVTVGDREEKGDDLACLFVRPRPGSDRACVAAVAGSGPPGMRLTDTGRTSQSGVAYPDCLVLGAGALREGGDGVVAAGFFGTDWGVAGRVRLEK